MLIYEEEKQDGLADLILAKASVSYASFVEPCLQQNKQTKYLKSIASFDDEDLYYVQSILVSSSWNKNDDIFEKAEIWKAKNTPEHKPTNLEHDEHTIIGHIISNWPITEDGILIDENTPIENLPEKYHILTGSVIYKGFSDVSLRERSLKLIAEIENQTKYVSMECFFKGFDYGVLNKNTNEYKILSRNDQTAYLTKYLRAYGGIGEHQDYKIGRVLRNITFTGKGFVDKPANQDSIIFSQTDIKSFSNQSNKILAPKKNQENIESGVLNFQSSINSENLNMSLAKEEHAVSNTENTENTENTTVTTENTDVVVKADIDIQSLKSLNDKLQADIIALTEANQNEIEAVKQEAAKKDTELKHKEEEAKKMKATVESMQIEISELNEVLAGYKTKEEEMLKKEKMLKRKAALVEKGLDNDTADSVVTKFDSISDDDFDTMASIFSTLTSKKEVTTSAEVETETNTATESVSKNADPAVLDFVEVQEDVNLSIGGEAESEMDSTRAALVEFVYSKLGKKTNK
jgi:hypothetical protein